MTKADLIAAVAADAGIKKSLAEKTLDAFIDTITQGMKKGEKVSLTGFGTFHCSQRKARTGRNPRSGTEITIPACSVPRFRPATKLREALK